MRSPIRTFVAALALAGSFQFFLANPAAAHPGDNSPAATRRAVEPCNRAGGGRVVVPAGTFTTGAIHLKSNVNLHVSRGATVKFSQDPAKYLPLVFTRWEG